MQCWSIIRTTIRWLLSNSEFVSNRCFDRLSTNGRRDNDFKKATVHPEPFDFAQESPVEGELL